MQCPPGRGGTFLSSRNVQAQTPQAALPAALRGTQDRRGATDRRRQGPGRRLAAAPAAGPAGSSGEEAEPRGGGCWEGPGAEAWDTLSNGCPLSLAIFPKWGPGAEGGSVFNLLRNLRTASHSGCSRPRPASRAQRLLSRTLPALVLIYW